MNLKEIRQKYPQYNDLSDQDLAGALHKKFYSDMPKVEFEQKIGLSQKETKQPGFFERGATTAQALVDDIMLGASQRTSPIVQSMTGEQNRQRAPQPEQAFFSETGRVRDARKQVVLRDPQTGDLAVFQRTPETDESLVSSLGRVVRAGVLTSPITRLPGATAARPSILQDFAKVGVDPNLATGTGSRLAGRAMQAARETPFVGPPVEKGLERGIQQTAGAAERLAGKYGVTSTAEGAGSAIRSGIGGYRARFADKADRLANKIGVPDKKMGSIDNATAALKGPSERFPTAPDLGKLLVNPQFQKYLGALERGELTWGEMKEFRSAIGRRLGQPSLTSDIPTADLKQLYAALSKDMEAMATAHSPQSAKAWQSFNRFYKAGIGHIDDNLMKIFDAPSAEAAYHKVIAAARDGGRSNLRQLRSLRGSLKPEEWQEVSSTVIRGLGSPKPGAGGAVAQVGFSPTTFVTEFNKLSQGAKNILFSGKGGLRLELDRLVKVSGAQREVEKLAATSPTYPLSTQAAIMAGLFYDPVNTALLLSGGRVGAQLMMSPKFVRWYAEVRKLKTPRHFASHVAKLSALARSIPEAGELQSALTTPQ